jgi:hypothetical protein
VIRFNVEEFDTNGTYDISNSRWTPGVAGYYQINALVWARSTGSGDGYLTLRKNGNGIKTSTRYATSTFMPFTINTIVQLSATDYIDIYATTSATVDTNPTFGPGTNQLYVYFNGCCLKTI